MSRSTWLILAAASAAAGLWLAGALRRTEIAAAQTGSCEVFARQPVNGAAAAAFHVTLKYTLGGRHARAFSVPVEKAGTANELLHARFPVYLRDLDAITLHGPSRVEIVRLYAADGQGIARLTLDRFQRDGPLPEAGVSVILEPARDGSAPAAWASVGRPPDLPAGPAALPYCAGWGLFYAAIFFGLAAAISQLGAPGRTFDFRGDRATVGLRLGAGVVAVAGVALRLTPWAGFQGLGFDENLYQHYLQQLLQVGLGGYPDIVDRYIEVQKGLPGSILPPTRFLYILFAYGWHEVFGGQPLEAFHAVSRLFGVLTLLVSGLFARRLVGPRAGLAVFALVAFSPLEIHLAQHALVDGFFAFWAILTLWAFWECLQQPGRRGWLAVYVVGLACMVTCKENSFFVFVAILALLAANRWLGFGTITPALLGCTAAGPAVGIAVLVNLAGGLPTLARVYLLSAPKNLTLPYAILTGDGPWYRYLVDLLTVSPVVLILALTAALGLRRGDRALAFLAVFIAASYLIMCNLKYGMNLRYASIWDLPLRTLAVAQVGILAARCGRREAGVFWTAIGALCAFDLSQYYWLAVDYPLYELAPMEILRAVYILK